MKYYTADQAIERPSKAKKTWNRLKLYLYVVPVILGLLLFTVTPIIFSLVCSFQHVDLTAQQQLQGWTLENWAYLFKDYKDVGKSLFITFRYAIFTVVTSMIGSYFLALLLNRKLKGTKAFRVIYYLPTLIPAVASTYLWAQMTAPSNTGGFINIILNSLGISDYSFYRSAKTVFPSIMMLSFWGWGSSTVMWLAQMQNIPKELYEAAEIDGAGRFTKTFKITIPMSTSMALYVLITSIIAALQVYSGYIPYIRPEYGNLEAFWFFGMKIFATSSLSTEIPATGYAAYLGFGYSCVLSWVLFLIIGLITLSIFKTSKWVYYGDER